MNGQPLEFIPLESNSTGSTVLGYRADADYLDLINAADMRQLAARHLLAFLSCNGSFEESNNSEIAGCFMAIQLLTGDAAALQHGAYQCWKKEKHGGAQ